MKRDAEGDGSHYASRFTHHAACFNEVSPASERLLRRWAEGRNPHRFSVATPNSDSSPGASTSTDGAYEKWLVRILLALAFGLAFGIEGMTLVRSFLIDTEEAAPRTTENTRPVLTEGDPLVPALVPTVRARRLVVRATNEAWTFRLTARPDTAADRPYTLSFDRLTTSGGSEYTAAPRHTWPAADTASFTASWTLPVGQRPQTLTVTASTPVAPDSTASVTRTLELGHVPVRMQRN